MLTVFIQARCLGRRGYIGNGKRSRGNSSMSWMQVMHARSRESGKSDDPQAQVVEDSMESWWTPELLSVEVLRNAIDCGEFVACYQPQFDLDGGICAG
jgi:hypothetical protein